MTTLRDIFDVAADAFLEDRDPCVVLAEVEDVADWYWVIGPDYGRPAPQLLLGDGNPFTGLRFFQFPIVRRVFANMIANELVAVQPMSLPSGLLFYMDYRYESKSDK